jgi:predicted alpha/beta hydrolase
LAAALMATSSGIRVEKHTITTRDQALLGAMLYRAPDHTRDCAVIIAGAMGVKQHFYRHYASYLAEQGFVALTFDFRGIGSSKERELWGSDVRLWQWGAHDLQAVLAWIIRQYPAHRVLVVGHSLGGQILGLAPYAGRVDGLLGISAQSAYWNHWKLPRKLLMLLFWYGLVPASSYIAGYFPSQLFGLGDPVPKGVALDWAAGGRKARYLLDLYGGGEYDHYAAFKGRLGLWSFVDDGLAPARAVQALGAFYPHAQSVEHHNWTQQDAGGNPIGHMGFFRPGMRETLWEKSAAWLAAETTT